MQAPTTNNTMADFTVNYKELFGALGAAFSAAFGGVKLWKVLKRKWEIRKAKQLEKEQALQNLFESVAAFKEIQGKLEEGSGRMDKLLSSIEEIKERQLQIELLTSLIHNSQGIYLVMMGIAAWRSEVDGRCVFATEPLAEMMGCDIEDIKGFGWVSAIHEEDREAVRKDYLDACTHKRKFQYFYRYRRQDRSICYVRGVAYPIMNIKTGEVQQFLGQAIEISEQEWKERA